jgi:hypothetical protein
MYFFFRKLLSGGGGKNLGSPAGSLPVLKIFTTTTT